MFEYDTNNIRYTEDDCQVEKDVQRPPKRRKIGERKRERRRSAQLLKRLIWIDAVKDDADTKHDHLQRSYSRTGDLISVYQPPLQSQLAIHIPQCAESSLQAELVYTFSKMNLTHSWYAFVPSYIGHHDYLDAATRAIIKVQKQKVHPSSTESDPGVEEYLYAINALRQNLDESDATLVTIALLCLYESTVRRRIGPCISHRRGITAIATARGASKKSSSVARAVLYGNWTQDFRTCVAEGVPSPFEEAEWVTAGPAYRTDDLLPGVSTLRDLAQKTYIRLPRLIAMVRKLRETLPGQFDRDALDRATTLAIQLNCLQDPDAESSLLHRVHVFQTKSYHTGAITPYSLSFRTMDEFNAALLYWGARLTTINLCTLLSHMETKSKKIWTCDPSAHYGDLAGQKHRTIRNIMMSWEFTYENGLTLGSPAMTQAVLAVWWALKGEVSFNGMSTKVIKEWLRGVFQESVAGWPSHAVFECEQLDEVSEIFVGGEVSGFLGGIYN